jgi:hypothetical protein
VLPVSWTNVNGAEIVGVELGWERDGVENLVHHDGFKFAMEAALKIDNMDDDWPPSDDEETAEFLAWVLLDLSPFSRTGPELRRFNPMGVHRRRDSFTPSSSEESSSESE